jgi:hypothetical protein
MSERQHLKQKLSELPHNFMLCSEIKETISEAVAYIKSLELLVSELRTAVDRSVAINTALMGKLRHYERKNFKHATEDK